MRDFKRGLLDGLPIGLGYLFVSVGYGLLAVSGGLSIVQAVLISMLNLTSAGQLAGTNILFAGGSLVEVAVSQLFINMRYALMSVSLTQKLDEKIGMPGRLLFGFFVTDEIFAVSSNQEKLTRPYLTGVPFLPYIGWTVGTLLGAAMGALLPESIRGGMGLLLYAMFIAIIVPPAKEIKGVRVAVLGAVALRCAFRYLPVLRDVPGGFAVVLCALLASVYCALKYPIRKAADA